MIGSGQDHLFTFVHHAKKSERLALRIFACAQAVWPEEWFDLPNHHLVEDIFDFSFHAYRANELSGVKVQRISMEEIAHSLADIGNAKGLRFIFDYNYAINRIRHHTNIATGKANPPSSKLLFAQNNNVQSGFLLVSTESKPETVAIHIGALAYTHLQFVRPQHARYQALAKADPP